MSLSHRTGWFKSSYTTENGLCLEARHTPSGIDLRDSKNRTGPRLRLPAAAWTTFLSEIRSPHG
jgi:hypothetical protein